MSRPALLAPALGLAALAPALAGAACGGPTVGRSTPGGLATGTGAGEAEAPAPSTLLGDYECRFARGESELEPSMCAIRDAGDGTLRLEQPGGAIRLEGEVVADPAGFRLRGEIVCTAEPCPPPGSREIVFFTQRAGAYSAVVPLSGGELLNIDLARR